MKIILLCYKLSPNRGSEHAVAWNFLRNMSSCHEFYVMYGHDGTEDLREMREWIEGHPNENIHYIPITIPQTRYAKFTEWVYRHEKFIGFFLKYKIWHREAYKKAKQLCKEEGIDVIHYLNPIGFKEPGECWKIKGVPYVWGPIQGVQNWPLSMWKAISVKGRMEAIYRLIAHNAVLVGSLKVRRAVKRADYIWGVSKNTLRQFKTLYGKELGYLPENGIMQMNTSVPVVRNEGEPLRLIWVGKFEDRKCLHLLLMALGKLKGENWQLTVCAGGDGRKEKLLTAKLGLGNQIDFKGRLTREEVQECFRRSHLHVITSLQEATTTVLLEAMSWAVPTMTLDHCGMGAVVCQKCGIKIPITTYQGVIDNIAEELRIMIEKPEKVEQLSYGVIECSKEYLWENRVRVFNDVYQNVVEKYEK